MLPGACDVVYDTSRGVSDALPRCKALGGRVVCAARGAEISVNDSPTGDFRNSLRGHTGNVTCLAASADGAILYSGSADGAIIKWDLEKHSRQSRLATFEGHGAMVTALVVYQADNALFSASADATIRKWDLATGELLAIMQGHKLIVMCLALSESDDALYSGSADRYIIKWRASSGERLLTFPGHELPVVNLTILEGASELLSAEWGGARIVNTWCTRTGALKARESVPEAPVTYFVL